MTNQLKAEEGLLFVLAILGFSLLDFSWWYFPLFILTPDIGMLGYLRNPQTGALTYNLFHHKGVAAVVIAIGYLVSNSWVLFAGIILFGHSSMDRLFGYGLKYPDSFHKTHLGDLK